MVLLLIACALYLLSIKQVILSLVSFSIIIFYILTSKKRREIFGWIYASEAGFAIVLGYPTITIVLMILSSLLLFYCPVKERRDVKYGEKILMKRSGENSENLIEEPQKIVKIFNLTPNEFKKLIVDLLTKMNYKGIEIINESENGIDVFMENQGKKLVLMVRRYKGKVSSKLVRKLFELMVEKGADGGVFVSISGYSDSVYRFIEGKPVELLDGREFSQLLKDYLKITADINP